ALIDRATRRPVLRRAPALNPERSARVRSALQILHDSLLGYVPMSSDWKLAGITSHRASASTQRAAPLRAVAMSQRERSVSAPLNHELKRFSFTQPRAAPLRPNIFLGCKG